MLAWNQILTRGTMGMESMSMPSSVQERRKYDVPALCEHSALLTGRPPRASAWWGSGTMTTGVSAGERRVRGDGRRRTCASSAWRTAAWCGVVNVRVRFFLGGGPSGALSEVGGLLEPPSISVSAMSPCEDDTEGLERSSRFLLREPDSTSGETAAGEGMSGRDKEEEGGGSCEAMLL